MENKEFIEKMAKAFWDAAVDNDVTEGKLTEERAALVKKKLRLMDELHKAKDNLEDYLGNGYNQVAEYVNEHMEKEIALYKDTAEKCKKWMDDNNLPYETEEHKAIRDLIEEKED